MMRWLRRERRALLLLPVALIAVAVGAGSRLDEYWWDRGFHEKAAVEDGWAEIRDEYDDDHLTYPIRAEFTVDSIEPVPVVPGALDSPTVATGGQLWKATLSWKADPDVVLIGCNIALMDGDGVRYDADGHGWDGSDYQFNEKCVPDATAGPRPSLGSTAKPRVLDGDEPRPESWQTTVYAVVKAGVVPTALRVWYFLPRYAELPLDAELPAGSGDAVTG
ncbi:hypothetical protein [Aeromicrobium panaciterrae]|uniref:hypothetical protein n=1 Tax=Aeromicrobium panaciterrae TaxID=363861 RepID=UPI0031E40329